MEEEKHEREGKGKSDKVHENHINMEVWGLEGRGGGEGEGAALPSYDERA